MATSKLPFEFVIENLSARDLRIRPMFGCHAIYFGDKILVMLRKRSSAKKDNGVWFATATEHHDSLRKIFPSMRSITVLGTTGQTTWQIIPEDSDNFEAEVNRLCELILKNDARIGKIPKKKKKKSV